MSQEAGEAQVSDEAMEWSRREFDAYAKSFNAAGVLISGRLAQAGSACARSGHAIAIAIA